MRGIRRSPVNSPHKGPVTRKMVPFDDVIVFIQNIITKSSRETCALNRSVKWNGYEWTHRGRDKMDAISQTTFYTHILEWIFFNFKENFTETCSYWSNWQLTSGGSDNGLAPNRQQVIIWANDGLVGWRIYASLRPRTEWPELWQ